VVKPAKAVRKRIAKSKEQAGNHFPILRESVGNPGGTRLQFRGDGADA